MNPNKTNPDCIMCAYETDIYENKREIPSHGSDDSRDLLNHNAFRYHHPDESCSSFRETTKIRKLRNDAENALMSAFKELALLQ